MNYVFIGVDQLRFDTLGFNGGMCKTPNLDKLAEESIQFTKAYTVAPLCTPARASMFTGVFSFTHKMSNNCDMYHYMASELENPSLLLHNKLLDKNIKCGYVGKWHVGTEYGPGDFGFDGMNVPGYGSPRQLESFKNYLGRNSLSYSIEDPIYFNPNNKTLSAGKWNGPVESTTDYFLADETIGLLEKYKKEGSDFFVTCQFWGPHGPHFPPTEYLNVNDRELIKPWDNMDEFIENKPNFVKRHLRDFYRNPPKTFEEWREVIGLYYDYMTFIDSQIGRIIQYIMDNDMSKDTMIIFTTDHGDMKGAHNGLIDKGFLYEEAIHIPLLVKTPNQKEKIICEEFAYNMDVLPTILANEDIDISHTDGIDLLGLVNGSIKPRTSAFIEFHGLRFLYTQRAVISKNNFKYIWTPGDFDEMYDLNNDPYETINLIDSSEYKEEKNHLQSELKKNAVMYKDPTMDYVYKILGDWQNPSGKFDTTSQSVKEIKK